MPAQNPTSPISVRLPAALKARVQKLAATRQRSTNTLVVQALTAFVEREEERNTAWQDAMHAWENYRSSGLHCTSEEMDAWFEKLETGIHAEPPLCHR